jgi:hypothetical protein
LRKYEDKTIDYILKYWQGSSRMYNETSKYDASMALVLLSIDKKAEHHQQR